MSRGKRDAASGILKSSMRDNYTEHGVDEVRTCLSVPTESIGEYLRYRSITRKSERRTAIPTFPA